MPWCLELNSLETKWYPLRKHALPYKQSSTKTINITNIISSQTPIFPPFISLPDMIDTQFTDLPKNSTSPHLRLYIFWYRYTQEINYLSSTSIPTSLKFSPMHPKLKVMWESLNNDKEETSYTNFQQNVLYTPHESITILKALEYSLEIKITNLSF